MDDGESDRNLKRKDGKRKDQVIFGTKISTPLSPQKTSCYADVFTGLPKSRNRPKQDREINQNQLHQHRMRLGRKTKL